MSSREDILTRVRANQPAPVSLPAIPAFAAPPGAAWDRFAAALVRMGGKVADAAVDGDLDALVRGLFPDAKVICSAAPEVDGNRPIADVRQPTDLHDVDVGVVRALYGVAETGSVWITDAQFKVNALGFLSQHLIVLLDSKDIVENIHEAYGQRIQFDAAYGVLMTGPSATADIEGVLIHGAQGVRSLTVVAVSRR